MKKPSVIQTTLDRCLAEVTAQENLLPKVLANAAKRLNLSFPEVELKLLATAILNAKEGKIQVDLDPPCAFGQTEEEVQATVKRLFSELEESITEIGNNVAEAISLTIPDALATVAELIGDHISEGSFEHTLHLKKAHTDRAETVQRLWGTAIEQLDFLRHIVLEWDYTAQEHRNGAYANPNTAFALSRLVARTYEIVGEIITLGRAGYADGALARWRSLHEVCVIAMFLAKRSDRCAQMYLSHHCVEELRLLETDKASGAVRVGVASSERDRYVRGLRQKKTAMVNKFGAVFANDYGWASVELDRTRTTFRDLENQVELKTLRRGYQQANNTIHGGALAALTRISLGPGGIDGTDIPPAYGCEVAIKYAAASLSIMIAELCLETENSDLLTMSMVVHNFASKVDEQIKHDQKRTASDSLRAKILLLKGAQRRSRRTRR